LILGKSPERGRQYKRDNVKAQESHRIREFIDFRGVEHESIPLLL